MKSAIAGYHLMALRPFERSVQPPIKHIAPSSEYNGNYAEVIVTGGSVGKPAFAERYSNQHRIYIQVLAAAALSSFPKKKRLFVDTVIG